MIRTVKMTLVLFVSLIIVVTCFAGAITGVQATNIKPIAGDINGDGSVNNKDLTRLMKYLAGENVEVVKVALDPNGDGNVNNKDLTRLMKYLSGEDVVVGLSGCTHDKDLIAAVEATCTNDGNIAYLYCDECDKYFSDTEGVDEITLEDTIIKKIPHVEEIVLGYPATTEKEGLTDGIKCSVCGTIIKEQEIIPIGGESTKETYTVTFYDYDGITVLKTETDVVEGGYAIPPTNPNKAGASFMGWEGNYYNVTKNESVRAVYSDEKNVFVVESTSAGVGDTITVLVSVDGSVNTCGFDISIFYDTSLELVSYDNDLDLDVIVNDSIYENGIKLNFSSASDKTKQRDIIELKFKVKNTTKIALPITVQVREVFKVTSTGVIENTPYIVVDGVVKVQ